MQVSRCIWFGNDGVVILDSDRSGKTHYLQLGVIIIIIILKIYSAQIP